MRLRVRQSERPRRGRDDPHEAFADPEARAMHGFRPQAFGGEELQHLAGPHDVTGADLGDHVRGDDADNGAQTLLRGPLPRHHVAQTAEHEA
jgi:hypothetical protein